MDVGAIEAFNHRGCAVEPLYGLEDFEGDAGAAARAGEAARVDAQSDVPERLGEREGVDPDFPDVVPGADVEGRGDGLPRGAGVDVRELEGDVADASSPVGDAELARTRGDILAILASHVHDARANLRLRHPT